MYFIITVDTESDIQKSSQDPVKLENLSALPKFQALCDKYGVVPTYLVTYEVVSCEVTSKFLSASQNEGRAEIGTHLHPWTTPPLVVADQKLQFPSNLSLEDFSAKFQTLHQQICEKVGRTPTSYRAGRWGFDSRQADILKQNGYLVDCSMTPKIDWRSMGGPDFRQVSVYPFSLPNGLLEVPMTILFTGLIKKESNILGKFFSRLPAGVVKKVLNKLFFRMKWFRVFPNSTMADWQGLFEAACRSSLPAMLFMFHSNDLGCGTGQFTKTNVEVERFFRQLEDLFKFVQENCLKPVTLTSFARKYGV